MNDEQTREAVRCRVKLRKNYTAILSNVLPHEVADYLFQAQVITRDWLEDVTNERAGIPRDRMARLFGRIYETPDFRMANAYDAFIQALDERDQDADWLADQIRETIVTDEEVNRDLEEFVRSHPAPAPFVATSALMAGASGSSADQTDASATTVPKPSAAQQSTCTHLVNEDSTTVTERENEPRTIAYASSIVMYRYIRTSDQRATVSYQKITAPFRGEANELGLGSCQTSLDMRTTVTQLRKLADIFERDHHSEMDRIVDQAVAGGLQASPNWFVQVARDVLDGGVSWGRLVSLVVFASRFAYRVVGRAVGSALDFTRVLGSVVLGFAELVRDSIAGWLSGEGGWVSFHRSSTT